MNAVTCVECGLPYSIPNKGTESVHIPTPHDIASNESINQSLFILQVAKVFLENAETTMLKRDVTHMHQTAQIIEAYLNKIKETH